MLPADRAGWEQSARDDAMAMVSAAPSLVAKLPLELLLVIADMLNIARCQPDPAELRACAFLRPAEDTIIGTVAAGAAASQQAALVADEEKSALVKKLKALVGSRADAQALVAAAMA